MDVKSQIEMNKGKNMGIYEYARAVPGAALKAFDNGSFKGTDIQPMWRIKMLTEMFGPSGIGWYTEVLRQQMIDIDEDTTFAIVDLNLYIKVDGEWSKPIFGTGGNKFKYKTAKRGVVTSDEGYKMAYTDALSVACKALGIGADVYFSNDPTKYSRYAISTDTAPEPDPAPAPASDSQKAFIRASLDAEQIARAEAKYGAQFEKMTVADAGVILQSLKNIEAKKGGKA